MEKDRSSWTSDRTAVARALHQAVDRKPLIFVDPLAPVIIDVNGGLYTQRFAIRDQPFERQNRTQMVVRSRYAEDCLADAVRRSVRQYVILGAGMDTFAYRQPPWAGSLRIYEVDHPSTQQSKQERLAAIDVPAPANLVFTPVNFETDALEHRLLQSDFDFSAPTFCSWLGVTMYLTEEAIDSTLGMIGRLPRGSEIVFTFIVPPETLSGADAEHLAEAMARGAAAGEPWISLFSPEAMSTKLLELGFSQAINMSPAAANGRYCRGRDDGLTMPGHGHLMRAIV